MSAATDVYTQPLDLDAIADELLAADPPERDDAAPLPLVGPSLDEAQDAEDAALLAAATNVHGSAVRIGSTHLSARDLDPSVMRWIDRAECAEAPPVDQDRLTESRTQAEAERVIDAYCSGCPVAEQCLDEGRATRAWGTHGGLVLVDGKKAPQHRPDSSEAQRPRSLNVDKPAAERARHWLAAYLAEHGSTQRRELLAAANKAGHSRHRIDHAARVLDIDRRRAGHTVGWSLPEVERATDEATQGAALWLIDRLAAHGPTQRQDVLTAAPYSRAASLAGALLLDLDAEADVWVLS